MSIAGITDLLQSERGIISIFLIVASTVLVIVGALPIEEWITYTKWIAVTLIASKTVTGAIETIIQSPRSQKTETKTEAKTTAASS
jgi:hypothetical protein